MKNFKVYQIHMNSDEKDTISDLGREKAMELMPKYNAYLNALGFGSLKYKKENLEFYSHVADVLAEDLDDVFEICNIWNKPNQVNKINGLHSCRSLSVGDIIEDVETGLRYIVDNIGFSEI